MNKGMGRAALVVSSGILVSRLLGYVRDAVMASVLGASTEADVYFAAFFIPDILFYLMAGGYLSITFIPILSRHLADGDEDGQWHSFAAVAKPVTMIMILLIAVGWVFTDQLIDLVYVTLPDVMNRTSQLALGPVELEEVTRLTRIVLPAQGFFMLGSLLSGVQYAHKRFVIPSLAPLVYNLSIIIGGLLGPTLGLSGPAGFAWGALAGAAIGNFALQAYGARQVGLRWVRGTSLGDPVLRQYLTLALPLMLGQSIAVLDVQFIPLFGQTLGESVIAELNYGRRLNMLPVGIIAQAAGVAAYPYLSQLAERSQIAELNATLTRAVRYVLFAGFAAAAAVFAAAAPAVRVAFQRGNFTADSTVATAAALTIFSLSIPLWGAHQVYARGFYARRQMWRPVLIGTAWAVIGIGVYASLSARFEALGIVTASVVTMAGYTIHLTVAWYRYANPQDGRELMRSALRSAMAAVFAGGVGWAVVRQVTGDVESMSFSVAIAGLAVATGVVGVLYIGLTRLLGSTELAEIR